MIINKTIIKSKLGKDVFVTFVSQAFIMFTFFVVNKILSNSLGIEGYGQYSLVKKNTAVISMIMLGGMGIALPRFVAYYKAKFETDKVNIIVVSSLIIVLLISLITIVCAVVFYDTLTNIIIGVNEDLKLYYVALLYSFSLCISAYMYSFFRGYGDFIKFNYAQILIQIIILISCFFVNKQLLNVLLVWSLLTILATFVIIYRNIFIVIKNVHISESITTLKQSLIEILPFGFTRLLGDFVLFSFNAIPLIFSNSMFGIKQTAFFSVGIMISNMITPLFGFLGMILLPYVSEHAANNNHSHLKTTVNKLMLLYITISIIMTTVISLLLNSFIRFFFNADYLEAKGIANILIWTIVAQAIYLLLRNPLDAVSKFPLNTINLIVSFIFMVILFMYSNSMIQLSYSFLLANVLLALLSIISWYYIYPKFVLNNSTK